MKKLLFLFTLLFAFGTTGFAQENERFKSKKDNKLEEDSKQRTIESNNDRPSIRNRFGISERLVFGGNLSMSFGTNSFFYIAPSVGYKINENLLVGGGYIYQYASFSRAYDASTGSYSSIDYESSLYGPKLFTYYSLFETAYLGAQWEYLNHDVVENITTYELVQEWTPVLFLEVGYLQPMGSGALQIGFKYNVLHDEKSPYFSPFIPSIGIFF